jgi:hypothetical protein
MQDTKPLGFRRAGAILAGLALPFLAVVAWGSIFDSRGGEPFAVTVMQLFLLSPLWILTGIVAAVSGYRSTNTGRVIAGIDVALLTVIVCAFYAVRWMNTESWFSGA